MRIQGIIPVPISRILLSRFLPGPKIIPLMRLTLERFGQASLSSPPISLISGEGLFLLNLAVDGVYPPEPSLAQDVSSYLSSPRCGGELRVPIGAHFHPWSPAATGLVSVTLSPLPDGKGSPFVTILLCAVRTFLIPRLSTRNAIFWHGNCQRTK